LPKEKIPYRFRKSKELIDEKAIADAPVTFIKGGCSESVGRFVLYKMEQFIYKCK
jgi:hypothetical protein